MPIFDTPSPISATVEVVVGDVRITATERPDTIVEVRPTDPGTDRDVRAAAETRVEFADGRLLIKAPRQQVLGLWGKPGSIDVEILLPAGSQLRGEAAVAAFHAAGRLGETRIKNSTGDIYLEDTGPLDASTPSGAIVVRSVTGPATVNGSGEVRRDRIDGSAVLKNTNGDSRIGEVTAGTVSIKTSNGELEVGIPAGTAAYLDLHTSFGTMHNRLDAAAAPGQGEQTVEIRARNSYGDIIVRRPS